MPVNRENWIPRKFPAIRYIFSNFQIESAETIENLKEIVGDNFDELAQCGFTRPSTKLMLADKVDIIQTISLHQVILKTLGELSQFRDGLETLGVGKAIEEHGEFVQEFFVIKDSEITAGLR